MSRKAQRTLHSSDARTDRPTLEGRWRALFGTELPHRAAWVEQAIAWQEQVLKHGDISPDVQSKLTRADRGASEPDTIGQSGITGPTLGGAEKVALRTIFTRKRAKKGASRDVFSSGAVASPGLVDLPTGTKLVKVHAGVTHVVEVTASGMLYKGEMFGSLSAVAKAITGTHWNGLLFFGLRKRGVYPKKAAGRG